MNRMFDLIPKTVENKRILIWEDVFNANLTLPKDVLVEIWSGASTLGKVLQAGFQAVNAYGWYLDKQTPYDAAPAHYEMIDTWKDFYNYEPTANITGDLSLLLGGEGAMWGEQVKCLVVKSVGLLYLTNLTTPSIEAIGTVYFFVYPCTRYYYQFTIILQLLALIASETCFNSWPAKFGHILCVILRPCI